MGMLSQLSVAQASLPTLRRQRCASSAGSSSSPGSAHAGPPARGLPGRQRLPGPQGPARPPPARHRSRVPECGLAILRAQSQAVHPRPAAPGPRRTPGVAAVRAPCGVHPAGARPPPRDRPRRGRGGVGPRSPVILNNCSLGAACGDAPAGNSLHLASPQTCEPLF